MGSYEVAVLRAARKDIERLDRTVAKRIFAKIVTLASNPRPDGCRKLHNEQHVWRIRVGDYRVIYTIYDNRALVEVMSVRHRREAYRDF